MKDDFKHKQITYKTDINKEPSVEVLRYQLTSNKRDARKNVIITALVVGIVAFATGFVINDLSKNEVLALTRANATLQEENVTLKAQITPEEK